jgi:putative hydrolase of the HAD superfamily
MIAVLVPLARQVNDCRRAGRVKMLQGLILDFGEVVTKGGRRRWALRSSEAELGLSHGTLEKLLFDGEHWKALSTGRCSEDEYWSAVRKALDGRVPAALEPFRHSPFAYEEPNQRMVALARRLHRCYRLALLSNATTSLEATLDDYGLATLFDVIVNSARVGLRKPDPPIYQLTLDRLGLAAQECLFVDDKERNTEAARDLGLQTVTFRSAAHLIRQLALRGVSL